MSLVKARPRFSFPSLFRDNWLTNDSFWDLATKNEKIPAANIIENKDNFSLNLVSPGFKKEDFELSVKDNKLVISASRKEEKEEKDDHYYHQEYRLTSFERSFFLPENTNPDLVSAAYENGILKVTIPKFEESEPEAEVKKIAIF